MNPITVASAYIFLKIEIENEKNESLFDTSSPFTEENSNCLHD